MKIVTTKTWPRLAIALALSAAAGGLSAETFAPVATFRDVRTGSSIGFALALSADDSTAVMNSLFISSLPETLYQGGRVYVYARPSGGWTSSPTPAAILEGSSTAMEVFGFGVAVSADGSVVAVSAPTKEATTGSVYVFVRPAAGWSGQPAPAATLTAPGIGSDIDFNLTMSADGSMIVAGQPALKSDRGTALVFVRPAGGWAGTLSAAASLEPPTSFTGGLFGLTAAASADGTMVVVGSPGNKESVPGSAFVFTRPAGGWAGVLAPGATLADSAPRSGDAFGILVGMSRDGSTVAALDLPTDSTEVADIFSRPGAGWSGSISPAAQLSGFDSALSLAVSGDGKAIAVGNTGSALTAESLPASGGAGYVYERPAGGWKDASSPDALLIPPAGASTATDAWTCSGDESGAAWLVSYFARSASSASIAPEAANAPSIGFIFEKVAPSRSETRALTAPGLARCRGR